jgi:hypothetical protein
MEGERMNGWVRRIAMAAAGLACLAGIILLLVQAPMTARRDQAAFEEGIAALRLTVLDELALEEANWSFFDLADEQDTGKNRLFDLGTALLAIGVLVLAGVFVRPAWRVMTQVNGFGPVALFSAIAAAGFSAGAALQAITMFERYDVPP